jgi:hypothetical protein
LGTAAEAVKDWDSNGGVSVVFRWCFGGVLVVLWWCFGRAAGSIVKHRGSERLKRAIRNLHGDRKDGASQCRIARGHGRTALFTPCVMSASGWKSVSGNEFDELTISDDGVEKPILQR